VSLQAAQIRPVVAMWREYGSRQQGLPEGRLTFS